MSATDVASVATYRPLIESSIQQLSESREENDADSPVSETDCAQLINDIREIRGENPSPEALQIHHTSVETVIRDQFVDLVATVEISEPSFAQVWVLLDVVTVLSDNELCEPGLVFWLVEELLDSQTIDGCRKVFDYLESRREKITAKHFKHKSLVILRCCNELLRRLSRAEDTVFCGRVFIFLFQSFPLGDKSSVNLRGEFHVENVTTFDPAPTKSADAIKPMELDTGTPQATSGAPTPASGGQAQETEKTARNTPVPKPAKTESKDQPPPPDLDILYPKFWTLQSLFSSPTRLFEPANMSTFKDGIALTLACFKSVSVGSASTTNPTEVQRGLKRKRTELDSSTSTSSTFNPKYLTNRDLFDLEIHDIAFRRHILVQALIMIDFLLSLAPAAKAKFEGLTNKSVLYNFTLSEEDSKWAQTTRASIASYLQQGNGNEGKFYYRMVDTVLSRDKNWVRWKAENCPSISHDSVTAEAYLEGRDALTKLTDAQKTRLIDPPGAEDLAFVSRAEPLEALKHPSQRHKVPTAEEYYRGIETDDLDMDFAATEDEKREIEERKAGRVWRAIRSSNQRFVLCEKVQYGGNLKALVEIEDVEKTGDGDGEGDGAHDATKPEEEHEDGDEPKAEEVPEGAEGADDGAEEAADAEHDKVDADPTPADAPDDLKESPSVEEKAAAPVEDVDMPDAAREPDPAETETGGAAEVEAGQDPGEVE